MEDNSLIFGFEAPSRSLCPVQADTETVRFLVTSQKPNSTGIVSLVTYNDDHNQITRQCFKLGERLEPWKVASSPHDERRFCVSAAELEKADKGHRLAWSCRIYEFDGNEENQTLTPVDTIEYDNLLNCVWRPEESLPEAIMLVSSTGLSIYENGQVVKIAEKQRGMSGVAVWDPHHASRSVACAAGHSVKCYDVRDTKRGDVWSILEHANVKSIDFNPNKQNQLAVGGEDGEVRFYDVRNTKERVHHLKNLHTHWVWSVKYNPVHDQLFLSSGGDGRVYLHSITSISSEPFGSLIESEVQSKVDDGVILKLEEHDDAVYSCEWSTSNPWLFASLSYDGRLVINQVPKSIKYDILL